MVMILNVLRILLVIVELNYGIVLILPLEMLRMSILLRICIKVIILNSDVVNLILTMFLRF